MKKTLCILLVLAIGSIVFMLSCTKKSIDQIPGGNSCDTTSVSYQTDILPIMQTYCYPCHSNNNKAFSNGIVLEGYNSLVGYGKSPYLLGTIRHEDGFNAMPYGKPKLSDCLINKIVAWTNQQFPN